MRVISEGSDLLRSCGSLIYAFCGPGKASFARIEFSSAVGPICDQVDPRGLFRRRALDLGTSVIFHRRTALSRSASSMSRHLAPHLWFFFSQPFPTKLSPTRPGRPPAHAEWILGLNKGEAENRFL